MVGFTLLIIVVLCLIHIDGKPVLDYNRICREYVMWDLYLLVVIAVFFSGCLLDDATGIREWLVILLNPIFGGHGQIFFIIVILIIGVILTNVANNAIIGAIMMQILVAMVPGLGIENPIPFAMVITQAMFLAMLTPAASPYAAVLYANDHITTSDIFKYGSIFIVVALVVYLVIGLPIANILF